jgi:hypothetical protein
MKLRTHLHLMPVDVHGKGKGDSNHFYGAGSFMRSLLFFILSRNSPLLWSQNIHYHV